MKLLTLTHFFASHRGGIEIVAEQLNKALAATGPAEIVWAASDGDPPPHDFPGRCAGLACSNVVERLLGLPWPIPMPSALRTLRRLVDEADIVMMHDTVYPTNVVAFLIARWSGKPIVIVQHIGHVPYRTILLNGAMSLANRLFAIPMLSNADRVVFISGLTARFFQQRCNFRHPPRIIFNGIADSLVTAAKRSPKRKFFPNQRPTVVFVGRLLEKKGLYVLEHVVRALPNIQFVFAGWGPIRPEDWQAENITVHRDLHTGDLFDVYRSADLLVLPSGSEGFPLVVQEALCCGLPVLCSEEILHADPWLRGRIEVAPVDLADAAGTAAIWSDRISGLLSGRLTMPQIDPPAAIDRYAWRRSAADYWALFDEIAPVQAAHTE